MRAAAALPRLAWARSRCRGFRCGRAYALPLGWSGGGCGAGADADDGAGAPPGNSVCAFIHGFEPYFYIEAPMGFGPDDVESLCRELNVRLQPPTSISLCSAMTRSSTF